MCYPKKRLYSPCESWGLGIRGCPLTCHIRARGLECYHFLQRGSILRLSVQAIRAGKNSPPSAFKTFLTCFVSVNRGGIELFVFSFKSDSFCGMFLSCIDSADINSHPMWWWYSDWGHKVIQLISLYCISCLLLLCFRGSSVPARTRVFGHPDYREKNWKERKDFTDPRRSFSL